MNYQIFILIAFIGSVSTEALQLYELRYKVHDYRKMKVFKSGIYWLIVIGFGFVSALGAYFLFYEENVAFSKGIPYMIGASFPLILKKLMGEGRDAPGKIQNYGGIGTGLLSEKDNFKQAVSLYFS